MSRDEVEIVGDGFRHATGTLLMLLPVGGKGVIANVGGTEEEARGVIRAAAPDGGLPASIRIVLPGQDAWWDAQHTWPLTDTKLQPPADDSEAFLFNPLASTSWYPPGIVSLLRLALASSSPKGQRWMRWAFTRPKLSLDLTDAFSELERGELLDAVDEAWGRSRVVAPPGVTRLRSPPWGLLWWTGLLFWFALTAYAVRHHWPLWPRLLAICVGIAPAMLARRMEVERARSAPRRTAAAVRGGR